MPEAGRVTTPTNSISQSHAAPSYELRLDAPFNLLDGRKAFLKQTLVTNYSSAYRLIDDLLTDRLYDAKPQGFFGRLGGVGLRLLALWPIVFLNHEGGHVGLNPLIGDHDDTIVASQYPTFRATYYSGGIEQCMLFSDKILETHLQYGGPKYSYSLAYFWTKMDNLLERYLAPPGWRVGACNFKECGDVMHDPFQVAEEIAKGRLGQSNKSDVAYTRRDVGYSESVSHVGNAYHLMDPVFIWSAYQVFGGDGSPPPWYLPQTHFLDSASGPMFFLRERFPLSQGYDGGPIPTFLTVGLHVIINDLVKDRSSCGCEVGIKNLPLFSGIIYLDAHHRSSITPDEGYVADLEGVLKFALADEKFFINVGWNQKFGNGYLPGGNFFAGPTLILGASISPEVF